jgi:hypothetical protein
MDKVAIITTRVKALTANSRVIRTFDHFKTVLFVYVFLTQSIKAKRHLRARGIAATLRELYGQIAQVGRFLLCLKSFL